jgi:FtsP/CotA-like multicopper oxidase with cupredoxin domain
LARPAPVDSALPNDNREAAGRVVAGELEVRLAVRLTRWRPDAEVDSQVTVQAFAEAGGPARIPGPLLRVTEGSAVRVRIRNDVADSLLVVHGLRAGTFAGVDTLHVVAGSEREVRIVAGRRARTCTGAATRAVASRRAADAMLS